MQEVFVIISDSKMFQSFFKTHKKMVTVKEVSCVGVHSVLEGPHWSIPKQSLYFNDILENCIFRYDYSKDIVYQAKLGKHEGYIET